MTDTAAHGRHRPAGHHVPRARRHLPGRRPPHDPGPQADPRAVRRVPHQPLRHRRAGAAPGCRASGLRHDRVGADRRSAATAPAGPTPRPSMRAGGWSIEPDFRKAHHLDGFPTPDGRFRFKPDWAALGPRGHLMPQLPDHMPAGRRADARQALPPGRRTRRASSSTPPSPRCRPRCKREQRPTALMQPRHHGPARPRRRRPGPPRQRARLACCSTPRRRPGQHATTIVVESIWPNRHWAEGIGINLLLSADPAPPNGGAAIHDTAVWLEPVHEVGVAPSGRQRTT